MSKLIRVMIAATCLTSSIALAQVFSFQTGAPATTNKKTTTTPVMTPQEFQSQVKAAGQQNQQQFNQRSLGFMKDQISAMPVPKPAAPPPLPPTTSSSPSTSLSPSTPTPPTTKIPPPTQVEQVAPPSPPPALPTPPPTAPESAPEPSQPAGSGYTGFQNASPAPTNSGSTTTSGSGGWSVKY